MIKEITIPEISENVSTGTIVAVLVKAGDTVEVDDILVEMETDKAVVEIPSPYGGKISEVLVSQGDEKKIGEVLVKIQVTDENATSDDEPADRDASAPGRKSSIVGSERA